MDEKKATLLLQQIERAKRHTERNATNISHIQKNRRPSQTNEPNDQDEIFLESIQQGKESPVFSLYNAELKCFFIWLELTSSTKYGRLSDIIRNLLVRALPLIFPNEWAQYQGLLKKHAVSFRRKVWKK